MFFGVEDVASHDTSWRVKIIIRSPKGIDTQNRSIRIVYLAVFAQICSLPLLTDIAAERERYFQEFMTIAQTCDLSFFDPDNGLEVKSKPAGQRNSSKYLYWQELKQFWRKGQSLLIYQHFPRVEHKKFIETLVEKVHREINVSDVITYRTNRVVFVLIPQAQDIDYYNQRSQVVDQIWDGQIKYGRNWE